MSHQDIINAIAMGSNEGLQAKIAYYTEHDKGVVFNKYGKTTKEMVEMWKGELENERLQ